MALEIDHVFISTLPDGAAERTLADFGLQFGKHLAHHGQGTANACAFFDNAYLELLWSRDADELESEVVRPLGLAQRLRWRETGASPFGIAFRCGDGVIPVETWAYEAPFMPAGITLPIATPRFSWHEPLAFFAPPDNRAPATWPSHVRPPLEHRGANRRLTGVAIYGPHPASLSPAITTLASLGRIELKTASEHCLELEWDGGARGEVHDFRSVLPLVLRW